MLNWKIFERYPNYQECIEELLKLPSDWVLTPLRGKRPYRKDWQHENPVSRGDIKGAFEHGEESISKKTGKPYRAFISGVGLRTGNITGGLVALDVDGESVEPLLQKISNDDLPNTVSWSSGKPGRRQLLYRVPEALRAQLADFNRGVINEYEDYKTARDEKGKVEEALELRYNSCQSVLPPSYHPQTGQYHWINSPQSCEIAIAPSWLCNLLISLATKERQESRAKQQAKNTRRQQRALDRLNGITNLEDCLEESCDRLGTDAFNWNGHDFSEKYGHLEGCCPNHESVSRRSFHVDTSTNKWWCYGCGVGGHVAEYRNFLKTGSAKSPRGKDFVDIVRELATEANIEFPSVEQSQRAWRTKQKDKLSVVEDYTNNSEVIPLEELASLRSKNTLQGKLKESLDKEAWVLCYDLIGTEKAAKELEINIIGDALTLFIEFCDSQGINTEDQQSIWNSANGVSSSFKRDIKVTLHWWRFDNDPEYYRQSSKAWREENPDYFEKRNQKLKATWRKTKIFTPDSIVNQKYIDFSLPENNSMLFVKSTTGTGKTLNLLKILDKFCKDNGLLLLGYRNTLLYQTCEDRELEDENGNKIIIPSHFEHIHDKNVKRLIQWDKGKIALCVDSLHHFKPADFDGKIIVIDEICSVLRHLLFSSTIKQREKIHNLFFEAIRRADRVICLDGMMADWVVNYMKALAPSKSIKRIENTFTANKSKLYFLEGAEAVDEIKVNDRTPWIRRIIKAVAKKEKIAITSDSQIFIEALDLMLKVLEIKTIRIDSKTVTEPHVRDFLKNPTEVLNNSDYQVVLYTPSAESGLDISIKNYFSSHYCFFFGVIGVDAILQMIARIRDLTCDKYFWCRQFGFGDEGFRSPSAEDIAKAVNESFKQEVHLAMAGEINKEIILATISKLLDEKLDSPHDKLANQLSAIHNFEMDNLRDCVLEQLKVHGYDVEQVTESGNDELKEQEKAQKKEVKQQNALDIFEAKDIPIAEAELPASVDCDWKQRCEREKAKLKDRLPGIENSSVWSSDLIYKLKYEDSKFEQKQRLFYLLNNPDIAKSNSKKSIISKFKTFIYDHNIFKHGLKNTLQKVDVLDKLNVLQLSNYIDKEFSEDSPFVKDFWRKGRKLKTKIALGVKPGTHPITFLRNVGKLVGYEIKKLRRGAVNADGKRPWIYTIDRESFFAPERLEILDAIARSYDEQSEVTLEQNNSSVVVELVNLKLNNPSEIAGNTTEKSSRLSESSKPHQDHDEQAFEAVHMNKSGLINIVPSGQEESAINYGGYLNEFQERFSFLIERRRLVNGTKIDFKGREITIMESGIEIEAWIAGRAKEPYLKYFCSDGHKEFWLSEL